MENTIRSVAAQRYKLLIDESIYCDLLSQLKATEAAARQIHTPQGREVADGLSKAIGLLCLAEFRRTSTEVSHPLPTDHLAPIPFIRPRVEGNRLTVELHVRDYSGRRSGLGDGPQAAT